MSLKEQELCAIVGHSWNYQKDSFGGDFTHCNYCGLFKSVLDKRNKVVNKCLKQPDMEIIQTWIHPFFGSSFRVGGSYEPTRREKIFGRGKELKGQWLNHI